MKSIIRTLALSGALLVPMLASAAGSFSFSLTFGSGGCANTICQVATTFIGIINNILVPLLFAIAFIVFLWGVFKKYILSGGDETAVKEGHRLILWGIIGFVIMVSLWGLVNIVAQTFGLQGYNAPTPPVSYPV